MPKLDSNHRLQIPYDFREKLNWKYPQSVAICYDDKNTKLFIINKNDSSSELIVCYRQINFKGRIVLSTECLELLNASFDDCFVPLLKGNKIFIKKV